MNDSINHHPSEQSSDCELISHRLRWLPTVRDYTIIQDFLRILLIIFLLLCYYFSLFSFHLYIWHSNMLYILDLFQQKTYVLHRLFSLHQEYQSSAYSFLHVLISLILHSIDYNFHFCSESFTISNQKLISILEFFIDITNHNIFLIQFSLRKFFNKFACCMFTSLIII